VYTYPSVPTPLPAGAPVPQNQNEGKNELHEEQNQNTAPPDTAAVAVSDTREELESGVLSVIFRFAFLCVLVFGGGWKGRGDSWKSSRFHSVSGLEVLRSGGGGSYSHEMWIRRGRHCRCRCWYRWGAARSVRRDWTGCEMRFLLLVILP
jgi:hypothetical protein